MAYETNSSISEVTMLPSVCIFNVFMQCRYLAVRSGVASRWRSRLVQLIDHNTVQRRSVDTSQLGPGSSVSALLQAHKTHCCIGVNNQCSLETNNN